MKWMNLEPITKSEVSQKEKNKYSILLTHMYEIYTNGIDEPICREGMETQTMDLWTYQGKERVGRMEKVASTYIHRHV